MEQIMASQIHEERARSRPRDDAGASVKGLSKERQAEVKKLDRDTEDLMDEIDELLESEDTISAQDYKQQGGQ